VRTSPRGTSRRSALTTARALTWTFHLAREDPHAWTEAELVLATVARRWRLAPADDGEVAPVARVTLRPGRPVRAIARLHGGGAM